MTQENRISVGEARRKLRDEPGAKLVCAYADDAKCSEYALEGSISLREFAAQEARTPKDATVVFYCA